MITRLLITVFILCTVSLFSQTPHPILRYFNATITGSEVRLNWVITGGNTCSGIVIQRSADGQFFETIGDIDGICGSSDVDVPYVFIDPNPIPNQINYYRLELGTQGYATPVSVEFVPLNSDGFAVTYSLTSRIATVYFENDGNDKVSYSLFSVSGQKVFEGTSNDSKIILDLSRHAAMIYLLTLRMNNKTLPVKIPGF